MVLVATDRQGQNPRAEHVHRDRKSAWNIKTLLCCCCLIAIISETRKPGKVFSLFFASYPVTLRLCTKEKKKKQEHRQQQREDKSCGFCELATAAAATGSVSRQEPEGQQL